MQFSKLWIWKVGHHAGYLQNHTIFTVLLRKLPSISLGSTQFCEACGKFFQRSRSGKRMPMNLGGRLANLSAAPVTRWPGQRGCLELFYSRLTPFSFTAIKSGLSLACLLSRFLARRSCSLSKTFLDTVRTKVFITTIIYYPYLLMIIILLKPNEASAII